MVPGPPRARTRQAGPSPAPAARPPSRPAPSRGGGADRLANPCARRAPAVRFTPPPAAGSTARATICQPQGRPGGRQPGRPVEAAHRGPRRPGQPLAIRLVDVADQRLAAGDDHHAVDVEEREPRAADQLGHHARVRDHASQLRGAEMAAMADVAIERRHRAARDGDDQPAARREERTDVAQHGGRVVDVLEHL